MEHPEDATDKTNIYNQNARLLITRWKRQRGSLGQATSNRADLLGLDSQRLHEAVRALL